MKINILGAEYIVNYRTNEEDEKLEDRAGYIDKTSKSIVILKLNDKNSDLDNKDSYMKKVLRHEIIHGFLFESGLGECINGPEYSSTHDEQMVDWFAIQAPKIFKTFKEADCF
ncbi:hypothetical protein [Anaerofustis stercorihominis]|uniref:hypothetical protein n=1 Tax=Anaerofustis stercorihominis TaxID=214853 RepID=UPI00399168ED